MRNTQLLTLIVLGLLIVSCTSTTPEITNQPTPTPLPADPMLDEPTFTVQRGLVERIVEETVRVVPINSQTYGFGRDGIVSTINVTTGQRVEVDDVLAEMKQDDANKTLIEASDALDAAKVAYTNAIAINERLIQTRRKAVDSAREALIDLLPGGDKDALAAAEKDLATKLRQARVIKEDATVTVEDTEYAINIATQALIDTQFAYSKAYWHWDWVKRYGTDPIEPVIYVDGKPQRNYLDDEEKRAYEKAFIGATDSLRSAERAVTAALRTVERTKESTATEISDADEAVYKAQQARDLLLAGQDNDDIKQAKLELETAEAELAQAESNMLDSEKAALDAAQRAYDKAVAEVAGGRIVATSAGVVASVAIYPGDSVSAFRPVIEIADPGQVEFAGQLSNDVMQLLSEGQPVEIRPVTRPDLLLSAVIRRLPAPYGSGGGSINNTTDTSTRFSVIDAAGFNLVAGETVGKLRIVIEQREDTLWLPPEAIRTFGERNFVVIRDGDRERRETVILGIKGIQRVEVLSGVQAGDVVVGQ
ncbi:MAG: HlyD family efflux transporter periplasmic adaptor subunit [Roseiflexaceae bacterium]